MHRRLSPFLLNSLLRRSRQQLQSLESSSISRSLATILSPANPPSEQFIVITRHFHPAQSSFSSSETRRKFSSGASGEQVDVNKAVDEINLKFAEAREEIESAMDSKETVYFNEEAECARAAVKEVLDLFEGLLSKVEDRERASLQRSMGLKMEQLKAEIQQLND